eukprot:12947303-Alexandrium_andersonii.AAC.1
MASPSVVGLPGTSVALSGRGCSPPPRVNQGGVPRAAHLLRAPGTLLSFDTSCCTSASRRLPRL